MIHEYNGVTHVFDVSSSSHPLPLPHSSIHHLVESIHPSIHPGILMAGVSESTTVGNQSHERLPLIGAEVPITPNPSRW